MKFASCKMLMALMVTLALVSGAARAEYAAIAYSPQTNNWGSAYGYRDLGSAQNDAMARCNAPRF